jgi:hypothetical protein
LTQNNTKKEEVNLIWRPSNLKDEVIGPNNPAINAFEDRGRYTSLAREVIQNSLDAAKKRIVDDASNTTWQSESEPIEITFETITIRTSDLPIFLKFLIGLSFELSHISIWFYYLLYVM